MSSASGLQRYKLVFLVLVALTVAVLYSYARIMLFAPDEAATTAESPTERGPILDRNGEIMAIQTRLQTVTAWTPDIRKPTETAQALSEVLQAGDEELESTLTSKSGYLILERRISPSKAQRLRNLLDEGELSGISLQPENGRSYPHKTHGAHVLGYVGTDNEGLAGVEYTMNRTLRRGDEGQEGENAYGNQVFLTLDVNVQAKLDQIARDTYQEVDANSVMILTMNAQSGELLGYASYPTYNPNAFDQYDSSQRKNRPISDIYEPGSVFKIFSLSAIMELGGVSPEDSFMTDGSYDHEDADFVIRDLNDYGEVSPREIIKYSSNVGAAYASETVSERNFYRMMRAFGFGRETGIRLPGEERGILRDPATWSARTQQTIAIGQEIAVTALQVVSAATVFANDGVMLEPRIVKEIVSPEGETLQEYGRKPVRRVLSEETAHRMLDYMRSATEDGGTARRLRIEGIDISAKTGTAQVFNQKTNSYSQDEFVASTLALFPTDNPQIITYVVIQHPKGDTVYGGRLAAPVVREAARFLIPYFGIRRDTDRVIRHDGRVTVGTPELPAFDGRIPDLTGLPKRTLLPLLAEEKLDVRIQGSGWVVEQDPPPGTPLEEGMVLRLKLE
jgi:cell division protein FtsI (penicillin-binding protein 3)